MSQSDFLVVCVDDDREVLEVTALHISKMGYKTKSFLNVKEAIRFIYENKHMISLILSDLNMEEIDGFKFKELLKKAANDIPFVIITGHWTKEMSSRAMELGIDAFIEKPASEQTLMVQIEKFASVRTELLLEEREIVEGFLEESLPILDEIENLILELEQNPSSQQTLSVYFRLLHTIKGTASCVGLIRLGNYTHSYEDFIGELRNGNIPVNTKTTNVLLEGLDDLKKYFSLISNSGIDKGIDIETSTLKYDISKIDLSEKAVVKKEKKADVDSDEVKSEKKDDDKMTVQMSLLNDFMEESGELTVIRNSILKTVKKIENKYRGDNDIELLNELLDGMYNVTSNIQGKITEMRKVPLKYTFRPFKRLIRDLSKQLGKDVELVVNGEELSVDNIVTKLFKNTLIHLLRNSLDHGLETPSVRVEAGKNPVGKLAITILEDGEDIVLKIEDDGYGIDPEIIKKVAIKKNLHSIEKLEQMSDLEIVNIVFDSGFSTAKKVSDLSGRGVGMDMVRGSFEEMGGSVHVNSKKGEGSVFTLKVPVPKSVLIVNTLSVKVADESFIFHMDEVAEVIRYESESANSKMYTIDGNLLLNHNKTMIQLIHLSDVFDYEKRSKVEDVFNVVVLRVGASRFGIIVDEIFDFEEVVSRQISDQVKSNSLFHGASLVGSGEVAMIISAEGIANEVNINLNSEKKSQLLEDPLNEQSEDIEIDEYMLFKYESNEYLCINLDDVERLEKIEPSKFEKVGDNFIIRYLDSSLPIIEPASHIGLRPFNIDHVLKEKEDDFIEIIVVNVEGKKLGLLVHELDEIQVSNEAMNTDTIINVGLKGSVYINGKTICVLDLKYLQREFKNNKSLIDFRVGQVVESDNVA